MAAMLAGYLGSAAGAFKFDVDPAKFADLPGDMISENALIEYFVQANGVPYTDTIPGPGKPPSLQLKRAKVLYSLDWVKQMFPGGPPYKAQDIKNLSGYMSKKEKYEAAPRWTKIPVLTEPVLRLETEYTDAGGRKVRRVVGPSVLAKLEAEAAPDKTLSDPQPISKSSFGPFRLRRSTTELDPLSQTIELAGLDAKIQDAKGARFGLTDNRLAGGTRTWNTEGALMLPFHYVYTGNIGGDTIFHAAPSVSWNFLKQEAAAAAEINELKFSAPVTLDTGHLTFTTEPFYQTDTDFKGEIIGVLGSLAYRGKFPLIGKLNEWQTWYQGSTREVHAKWNAKALVDYSDVREGSPWIKRAVDNDWLRLGGEASFDIGLYGKPDSPVMPAPITLSLSYRYMDTVNGVGGDSDLFKASLTYWINNYAGITAEYQKGDTPVAKKEIDLFTLGVELRY